MAGSQQFLSNLIEELITASNNQVTELTTVASGTSDQLTALQDMVTALGEVKTTTEANLGYYVKASTNAKLNIDNIYKTLSTITTSKVYDGLESNLKGTVKLTAEFWCKSNGSFWAGGDLYVNKNGARILDESSSDSGPVNIDLDITVEPGDIISFEFSTPTSNRDFGLENIKFNYDLILKDFATNPEVVLFKN